MKYSVSVTILILITLFGISYSIAQDESKPGTKRTGSTYLGDKKTQSGEMTPAEIYALLDKPLYSADSSGKMHQVVSFHFAFSERGIFADENGKPFINTDVWGVGSEKGIVPQDWRVILKDKMKAGDTVKFLSPLSLYDLKNQESTFYSPDIIIILKK